MMDDGNRELLTAIEYVSADGRVSPSLIIYKGATHYMGWHKFTGTDVESKSFVLHIFLKNGQIGY